LQLHRPHHRLDRAPDVLLHLEDPRTPRTAGLLALAFTLVGILDDRLGDPPGELLTQVPHRGGHLREECWRLMPLLLEGVEPLVKTLVKLLAQGGPLSSCTDLLERDNLSGSHG